MLRALLEACHSIHPGDVSNDPEAAELQRGLSLCMHEIRRQGVFQVEPPSESDALRKREAALQGCVHNLSATLGQWEAAAEAEPDALGAHAPLPAATDLELPPLPNLAEQLDKLQTIAALHADQVELVLRRVGTMGEESARQRKQLASAAHHASFSGYAHVGDPKLLIRSLVC